MLTLRTNQVRINASASSKEDAIRQAGQLLVESGAVQPAYVEAMLRREQHFNTYLGKGLAVPHAEPEDRHLIVEAGLCVLQVPSGVPWGEDQTATLVIGLAAQTDEHVRVLRRLTRVLNEDAQMDKLTRTVDPFDIIEALTGRRPSAPAAQPVNDLGFEKYVDVVVRNASGLHARPAAALVRLANSFEAEIRLRHGTHVADAKGILTVLQLGADQGAQVRVLAQGPDADAALAAIKAAIESGLGEP